VSKMTRNRILPILDILEVSFDTIGKYIKINGHFEDGEIILRWGIDQLTFRNLRSSIEKKYFDDMVGVKYTFRLLKGYSFKIDEIGKKIYVARLECFCDHKNKEIEFVCTELFAGNMEWFKNIKKIEEIRHMDWNNF
jgi:hypothetical protein